MNFQFFFKRAVLIKFNCAKSVFSHASTSTDAPLPMVTPSVWVLKVMRGSSGPGAGQTTNGEEGAAPQSTVGGYWAPDGGTLQGWINWRPEGKKTTFQWLRKKSNHLLPTGYSSLLFFNFFICLHFDFIIYNYSPISPTILPIFPAFLKHLLYKNDSRCTWL